MVLLVHFNLGLPLQERHSSQLDVDVIYAFVKEVSSPLGHLIIHIKKKTKLLTYHVIKRQEQPLTHLRRWYDPNSQHTIKVIMMGSPYVISFVDSIRMTVRLMVILTTPPRKAAAPMRA